MYIHYFNRTVPLRFNDDPYSPVQLEFLPNPIFCKFQHCHMGVMLLDQGVSGNLDRGSDFTFTSYLMQDVLSVKGFVIDYVTWRLGKSHYVWYVFK